MDTKKVREAAASIETAQRAIDWIEQNDRIRIILDITLDPDNDAASYDVERLVKGILIQSIDAQCGDLLRGVRRELEQSVIEALEVIRAESSTDT